MFLADVYSRVLGEANMPKPSLREECNMMSVALGLRDAFDAELVRTYLESKGDLDALGVSRSTIKYTCFRKSAEWFA